MNWVIGLLIVLVVCSEASIVSRRPAIPLKIHPLFHHPETHGHGRDNGAAHIKLQSTGGIGSHFVHPHAKHSKESMRHRVIMEGAVRAAASHAHPAPEIHGHSRIIVPPKVKMSSTHPHHSRPHFHGHRAHGHGSTLA
ncbi:unnamed protein product [Allacma fusca]|uniref:Uncharacterized protein n=1 Tax=Allacma fusca TaxID=39272 RepID=A0A8J2LJF2_9HEXA|nr:unnamed protein product [Allacma fusca]